MKNLKLIVSFLAIATSMTSCITNNETTAEMEVEKFETYVDSLSGVAAENSVESWNAVEKKYESLKNEVETFMENDETVEEFEARMNAAEKKYETYKSNVVAEKKKIDRKVLTVALFGEKMMPDDLKFEWVTTENIASVYEKFVTTADENKDNYTREQWDEIKMLYEALDTRKNELEDKGLSTADNLEIAKQKTKFAALYTIYRISSKSTENSEAKE